MPNVINENSLQQWKHNNIRVLDNVVWKKQANQVNPSKIMAGNAIGGIKNIYIQKESI